MKKTSNIFIDIAYNSQYNSFIEERKVSSIMLIGFSVSNYKSFNESQSISFLASKITRHKEHISNIANRKILKSGLIFGANACGKSNLVKAIFFSRKIILNGLSNVNLSKRHFRLAKDKYIQPGVFQYQIMIDNQEYSYGIAVSYANNEIVGEWLSEINSSGEEICLFNRGIDADGLSYAESDILFETKEDTVKLDFYLEGFGENISDAYRKKTILNDIALRTTDKEGLFAKIRKVYEWFEDMIILFPSSKYNGLNDAAAEEEKRAFFSKLMSFFDTGIESVETQKEEMDFDKVLENIPLEDAEKIKAEISNKTSNYPIMFKANKQVFILRKDENGNIVYNKLLLNHGNPNDLFEYIDESDGTKRLFDLIPLFYEKHRNKTIFIDEIDRSLHTNLSKRFLQLFYEISENYDCQIIATTHDSNLLDLDLLRQDEIWFIERQEDHSSEIYSLNRFKQRFDKKIDKDYLLGRYGAIPKFYEDILELEVKP